MIRRTDAHGNLIACGARWPELNAGRIAIASLACLGAGIFLYAFINDVQAGTIRMKSHDVVLALILIGTVVISCRVIVGGVRKRRSIVFHIEGTIKTPFGFPANERLFEMPYDQADIRSIEMVFNKEYQWEVLVYMRDGHILTWTQHQGQYDAHLIAVTLTNALQEIREAAASPTGSGLAADIDGAVRAAMSGVAPGDKVHVVID